MAGVLRAIDARSWLAALLCSFAFALASAYSLTAALGAASQPRAAASAAADDNAASRARWQAQLDAARGELARLPVTEPAAMLAAKAERARTAPGARCDLKPGDEGYGPVSRTKCPEAAAYEAQRGIAVRRAELEAQAKEANARLDGIKPTKPANSDAAALVSWLAMAGVTVSTDAVNRALALLGVLVLEFGGPLGLAVAHSLRSPAVVEAAQPQPQGSAAVAPVNVFAASVQSAGASVQSGDFIAMARASERTPRARRTLPKVTVANEASERLLALVRTQGGELFGGQRAIARALNISLGATNDLLAALAESGSLHVEPTTRGTRLRLAA
jgi:hypothetical protein